MRIKIVPDVFKEMEETDKYARAVIEGKIPIDKKRAEHTLVFTPEAFAKTFSPERIKLMIRIRKNDILNIYQLAKEINRPYEAVHRDLSFLKSYGLIKIKNKDKTKIPYIDENIAMEFASV
jgi:predicted transcriptional regulator